MPAPHCISAGFGCCESNTRSSLRPVQNTEPGKWRVENRPAQGIVRIRAREGKGEQMVLVGQANAACDTLVMMLMATCRLKARGE